MRTPAILTVLGEDRVGIVARVNDATAGARSGAAGAADSRVEEVERARSRRVATAAREPRRAEACADHGGKHPAHSARAPAA